MTTRHPGRAAILATLLLLASAGQAAAALPSAPPKLAEFGAAIPPRPPDAPSGSVLLRSIAGLAPHAQRAALVAELLRGNVPGFLRELRPVRVAGRSCDATDVVIWVTPDYLAVGSDQDFVRVPLGLDEALTVARSFGLTLPTTKMVDSIYRAAEQRLAPRPMPPGPEMTSLAWLERHERGIAEQLTQHLHPATTPALVAGNKKDLVLTPRLASIPGRVAIYGWHRAEGQPIQPLSTVHGASYADYSHGVRLVSTTAQVAGRPASLVELLADPVSAHLVSDEGPILLASVATPPGKR